MLDDGLITHVPGRIMLDGRVPDVSIQEIGDDGPGSPRPQRPGRNFGRASPNLQRQKKVQDGFAVRVRL
jgi:hypothetical protein